MTFMACYACEWDVAALEAEGWVCAAFYGHRGGVACFVMTKEVPKQQDVAAELLEGA